VATVQLASSIASGAEPVKQATTSKQFGSSRTLALFPFDPNVADGAAVGS
jgi:hypothetical protein